jgi:hypothetical protein
VNYNRVYLPPYIVPEMPDLSLIDEPKIYPYSQWLLPDGRETQATLEKWKLIDVAWNIEGRPKPNLSRYYFSYVGASQNVMLPDKRVFTGYALLETRYDKKIHGYAEPEEMWGIYLWAYKGQLSSLGKSNLALKMLWRHWEHKKKEDKYLDVCRRFHNTSFYKKERLLNNQLREIARWVWF